MLNDLVAGAAAGLAVAMPVGAIGTYLVGLAARERFGTNVGSNPTRTRPELVEGPVRGCAR